MANQLHVLAMMTEGLLPWFQGASDVSNLWELVSVVCGQQDMELSPGYSKGIMHKKHITKFKSVSQVYISVIPVIKKPWINRHDLNPGTMNQEICDR